MRTTISLDDGLYADLRRRAAEAGKSVSAFAAEAIRAALYEAPPARDPAPLTLVTWGSSGLQPGMSWTALDDECELADDLARVEL